ncbi:MAG: hypothetical protein HYT93_00285 [Parcubacteria group bacterium]|nr:hypothetical protein [Parcubacteria group bacterium]
MTNETRKFYPIGVDAPFLRIAFQLNFDLPLSSELSDWTKELEALKTNLVVHGSNKGKPVVHVALPAYSYIPGRVFSGEETNITFPGARRALAQPLHWLLLQRKNPRHFMICGRKGATERFPFGFSMHDMVRTSKKGWATETLQPLAYPGKDGIFNPVFVKIQLGDEHRAMFIEAKDEDGDIVVSVREVGSLSFLPEHMSKLEADPRRRWDD